MRRQVGLALLAGLMALGCGVRPAAQRAAGGAVRPGLTRAEAAAIAAMFRPKIPEMMSEKEVPGLALALVGREGPLWVEGFGTVDRGGGGRVDEDTIFSVQSTSKTVTTTAILVAVQEGLLDLDAPVTEYLPDFTVHSRFEAHPERLMTLRHLLAHRAGFTHEAPVGNNYVPRFDSFEAHVASIQRTWLRYPVGLHHAYSNLGVDLAGYVLGRESKEGFPRAVQERVLDPIGMTRSSYDWPIIRATANRAVGQWKLVKEMPLEYALIPSGGLYASARDMGAFLTFQLNDGRVGGRSLLNEALLTEMRTPSFAAPGQEQGYCLGLRRYQRFGRPYFNHSGAGFGFATHLSWYPALGVGVAVLANSMDGGIVHQLAGQIVDAVVEAEGIEPLRPRPFADLVALAAQPPEARRLLGDYLGRGSARLEVVLADGVVSLRLEGEVLPLQFTSATEAFIDWGEGKRELFRFTLDDAGRPAYALRVLYGDHYDFDHGPEGPPSGPDKPEWDAYLGRYEIVLVDTVLETPELRRDHGNLVFDDVRLVDEYEPGLFFDVRGEALDFRGDPPTFANIPLRRVP